MTRSADYAIQGFLYQFNKTVLEILRSQDDETIKVEGIVEDIEIASPELLTAIQCKYHESAESFNASSIYKPLLQMLLHFSENESANIKYVLFAHFKTEGNVDKSTFKAALNSSDKSLRKLIEKIDTSIDLKSFQDRFKMEFGPSYEGMIEQVVEEFVINNVPEDDVETLVYPNALNMIGALSIEHDVSKRSLTKKQFLVDLLAIRKTAISRWTLAHRTREKILRERRKQLKTHLDKNARLRYFVIDPIGIEDYDSEIVLFVTDYIGKYHFKTAHTNTPLLCIKDTQEHILLVQSRLFAKDIISDSGFIGGEFKESWFFREPMSLKKEGGKIEREFAIRLLSWANHSGVLNIRKCDDLFIIGESNDDSLDTLDVNVERLSGVTMKEIGFIMGLSDVYE